MPAFVRAWAVVPEGQEKAPFAMLKRGEDRAETWFSITMNKAISLALFPTSIGCFFIRLMVCNTREENLRA